MLTVPSSFLVASYLLLVTCHPCQTRNEQPATRNKQLTFRYFEQVLHFEDHALNTIVGGENDGCPHLAETESGHGRLLIGRIADRTFLQLDSQERIRAVLTHKGL